MKEIIRKIYTVVFYLIYTPLMAMMIFSMFLFDIITLPLVFLNKLVGNNDEYFYVTKRFWFYNN